MGSRRDKHDDGHNKGADERGASLGEQQGSSGQEEAACCSASQSPPRDTISGGSEGHEQIEAQRERTEEHRANPNDLLSADDSIKANVIEVEWTYIEDRSLVVRVLHLVHDEVVPSVGEEELEDRDGGHDSAYSHGDAQGTAKEVGRQLGVTSREQQHHQECTC